MATFLSSFIVILLFVTVAVFLAVEGGEETKELVKNIKLEGDRREK